MYFKNSHIFLLLVALVSAPSFAAFPNDLDDVVFIEEPRVPGITGFVRDMAVTGVLTVDISGRDAFGGEMVFLNNSKSNVWPLEIEDVNANAWLVVNVDGIWYAGTWEFMRKGQTVKSTLAMKGPSHLIYPPLSKFLPVRGEIYGFFNSCVTRNGITSRNNNCKERTNIALFKFGEGPVELDAVGGPTEPEPVAPVISPIVDLILKNVK
jgi:hypothetical protein